MAPQITRLGRTFGALDDLNQYDWHGWDHAFIKQAGNNHTKANVAIAQWRELHPTGTLLFAVHGGYTWRNLALPFSAVDSPGFQEEYLLHNADGSRYLDAPTPLWVWDRSNHAGCEWLARKNAQLFRDRDTRPDGIYLDGIFQSPAGYNTPTGLPVGLSAQGWFDGQILFLDTLRQELAGAKIWANGPASTAGADPVEYAPWLDGIVLEEQIAYYHWTPMQVRTVARAYKDVVIFGGATNQALPLAEAVVRVTPNAYLGKKILW